MNQTSLSKTKLTRQAHYNSSDDSISPDNFVGVPITKHEALDDIYLCFDMWVKGKGVFPDPVGYEYEEGEIREDTNSAMVTYWGNEFLFRDAISDKGQGVFHLVDDDYSVFSVGIEELRENTHVVFKETSFGVMWKILPLMGQRKLPPDVETCYIGQYDGCFTRNHDSIMDMMNIVDQGDLFGTFLDITIENRTYMLWTALCA